MLRLVFSKALEELGAPIHYTSPRIGKNFSNFSAQDCCLARGVAQVSSLPLSRSWVYIKKKEKMALLSHKHFFLDLNSCLILNQDEKSTFHHHSRKPTTWFH